MNYSNRATPRWRQAVAGLLCAAGVFALVSCGGSTSQYEAFKPGRVLAFGDDASVLTPSGQRYGVNGLGTGTSQVDCTQFPLWIQAVAGTYGFTFAQCNPTGAFDPQARTYAAVGAKVADVAAQVEAQVAAGGFRSDDLALVLVGTHDVLELYSQYPLRPEVSLLEDARERGRRMAQVVNRLVDLGAKVIVSNLPDMGLSPYAATEARANADADRAAMISRITAAFNEQLGANVLLDGRYVGLMQTDLRIQAAHRSPGSFGLSNATEAVCTVALPGCTTATLVAGATAEQYLWADATRLAPGGQNLLASLAVDRAQRNPF
jgi:hypothetical protein